MLLAVAGCCSLRAAPQLKYVVIVSRHGVRSPTWDAARLNQYSAKPWPDWGVAPGELTPHGFRDISILGAYYRNRFAHEGLLAASGCQDKRKVYIWADTDQRTLETGRAFSESVMSGCGVAVNSRGKGAKDPIFGGVPGAEVVVARVEAELRANADPEKLFRDHRTALDTLQFILDEGGKIPKSILTLAAARKVNRPGLGNPLQIASTLSENLLLEYANGMTGADLGWGRLTRKNLFQVLELHKLYADQTRRAQGPARARGSNLVAHVLASLEQAVSGKAVTGAIGPPSTALLILSGHDTNLSNIAGILGLSWNLAGYQPNETPPGGALLISLLRDSASGAHFVHTEFLAAGLDQMRDAVALTQAAPPMSEATAISGCGSGFLSRICEWRKFKAAAVDSIDHKSIDFELP